MVSALVSGSSGPGSSPGRGHCVVFLGKTLYSHSASLLVASCYKHRDKLRPDGPLGSHADFTLQNEDTKQFFEAKWKFRFVVFSAERRYCQVLFCDY